MDEIPIEMTYTNSIYINYISLGVRLLKEFKNKEFKYFDFTMFNLFRYIVNMTDISFIMAEKNKWSEAGIFLRTNLEQMELMQYFNEYPDEAKRWLIQNRDSKILNAAKTLSNSKEYKKYLNKYEFNGSSDKIITNKNWKNIRDFKPNFIADFIQHKFPVNDFYPDDIEDHFRYVRDVLSMDVHPTVIAFSPPTDLYVHELWYKRNAIVIFESAFQLMVFHFHDYFQGEILKDFVRLNTAVKKYFFFPSLDIKTDLSEGLEKGLFHYCIKEDIIKLIEYVDALNGNLLQPVLIPNINIIAGPTIQDADTIITESKCLLDSISNQIGAIDNKNLYYLDVQAHHFIYFAFLFINHIIGLLESIYVLHQKNDYCCAGQLMRLILEENQLITYMSKYPGEIIRWNDLNMMSGRAYYQNDNQKDGNPNLNKEDSEKYKQINYAKFEQYLNDNNYRDALTILNKNNFSGMKWFSPSFIRNIISMDKITNDDLAHHYGFLSKMFHPSEIPEIFSGDRDIRLEFSGIFLCLGYLKDCLWTTLNFHSRDYPGKEIALMVMNLDQMQGKIKAYLEKTKDDEIKSQTLESFDL